jgi:putative restriction endonuclease
LFLRGAAHISLPSITVLLEQVSERFVYQLPPHIESATATLAALESNGCGKPQIVHPRLGQGSFRILITDAYERRCVITGERTLPLLNTAHIMPFSIC